MQIKQAKYDGGWLMLLTSDPEAKLFAYGFEVGDYSLLKAKKRRSLDANAYAWVLIDKLEKDLGFANGYINPKKVNHFSHARIQKIAEYLGVPVSRITGETEKPATQSDGSEINPHYYLLSDEDRAVVDALIERLAKVSQSDR